jgi:hypothetical protein
MSDWQPNIDHLVERARVETIKMRHHADMHIAWLVSHHIRSMAQLRRDRAAEKLSKQQGERK